MGFYIGMDEQMHENMRMGKEHLHARRPNGKQSMNCRCNEHMKWMIAVVIYQMEAIGIMIILIA